MSSWKQGEEESVFREMGLGIKLTMGTVVVSIINLMGLELP